MTRGFNERHLHPEYAPGKKGAWQGTGGSFVCNSATWQPFNQPTSNLILNASPGDWIEVQASGLWNNEAVWAYLDVQSIVSGAPVNSWGTVKTGSDNGIFGWSGLPNTYNFISGGMIRQITSSDIDINGFLNIGLWYRTISGAKTLYAYSGSPFTWWAKNLRQ